MIARLIHMKNQLKWLLVRKNYLIKHWTKRNVAVLIILSTIIIVSMKNTKTNVAQTHPNPDHKRSRLVLGILADHILLTTLVNASQHTWIPSFPHDIYYFVGHRRERTSIATNAPKIIELSANDNDYPPVNKTFEMWNYFYTNHLTHYDYFMSIDADSYINVENFEAMLNATICDDCYIGKPSRGISYERDSLGLSAPYCAGMGYIVARKTLQKFGPYIDVCRSSTVSWHSDTEVGRCIYQHASSIACIQPNVSSFELVSFNVDVNGTIIPKTLDENKHMKISFPEAPPTKFFTAALVHPIKSVETLYRFHRQSTLQLRPILPRPFIRDSCVANPIIQEETHPSTKRVAECIFRIQKRVMTNVDSITAFAMMTSIPNNYFNISSRNFKQHKITLHPFYATKEVNDLFLTNRTGDQRWQFRAAMTQLIRMATERRLKNVLVITTPSMPHQQFSKRLIKILNENQCQAAVHGGVLLLGLKMSKAGWNILDQFSKGTQGECRNICTQITDSFGAYLHNSTFEPILTWLREQTVAESFHHLYIHLAKLGYPVRFAFPNLIIGDPLISLTDNNTNI